VGSTHTLSTTSIQFLNDNIRYSFDSWTDSDIQNHSYQAGGPDTIYAKFFTEYRIVAQTIPIGLQFDILGTCSSGSFNNSHTAWCPSNSNITISANQNQGNLTFSDWRINANTSSITNSLSVVHSINSPVTFTAFYYEPMTIPFITVSFPTSGQRVEGNVLIAGTASPGSMVLIMIDPYADIEVPVDDHGDWSYSLDTIPLSNGDHTLQLKSKNDKAESEVHTVELIIENVREEEPTESTNFPIWVLVLVTSIGFVSVMIFLWNKKRNDKIGEDSSGETGSSETSRNGIDGASKGRE